MEISKKFMGSQITDEQFEVMLQDAIKHSENNPIEIYADYQDTIPDEWASHLLAGDLESFEEAMYEAETSLYLHALDYQAPENFDNWSSSCENYDLLTDEQADLITEHYQEHQVINAAGYWEDCLRNTRLHIVAIPIKQRSEEYIELPHYSRSKQDNTSLCKYLERVHGWDGWEFETLYGYDVLKVCGTLDFLDVYKNLLRGKKIYGVRLRGSIVSHNNINGSGGHPATSGSKSAHFYKADFNIDSLDRYGVQEVFGFSESWWRDELEVTYR